MARNISLRIRRIYFDQIVEGVKTVELRKHSEFWRKRLLEGDKPKIAIFVCGRDIHRRKITHITEGNPEHILERPISEQGKQDIGGNICYAIWLGDVIPEISKTKLKSEHEMRNILKQYLETKGYCVLFANELGGGDFFDCVAVGDSVGAIELKLSNPRKIMEQAYDRLFYVNWAVALMPSLKSLNTIQKHEKDNEKILLGNNYTLRTRSTTERKIGLWQYTPKGINIIREPDIGEPTQISKHTIKMIRLVVRNKKLGIPNKDFWGHERGISLFGLTTRTKTMYGKTLDKSDIEPLEKYDNDFDSD